MWLSAFLAICRVLLFFLRILNQAQIIKFMFYKIEISLQIFEHALLSKVLNWRTWAQILLFAFISCFVVFKLIIGYFEELVVFVRLFDFLFKLRNLSCEQLVRKIQLLNIRHLLLDHVMLLYDMDLLLRNLNF